MWWFNKKPNHLPEPFGPFVPGCADVMVDYSIKGLFLRLYYPTDEKKENQLNYKKWLPWIPDDSYIVGIARLFMSYIFVVRLVLWWYSGSIHIPALADEKVKSDGKLKCVIFSHGLGGNRFLYSTVCCELASRGYLVAVLEHKDQSACNTYYYQSAEHAKNNVRTPIEHRRMALGKDHYMRRNQQIHLRVDEIHRTLDLLSAINGGDVPHNVMDDVPASKPRSFQLNSLVGRLDLSDVTAMGHSFGAATALCSLPRRKELSQAVLFDPWMFPIKDEGLEEKVKEPLLFVNTQTFHIETNVKAMGKFLDAFDNRHMYTILHTTHENQTDSVFASGYWLNWFMKKLDPLKAIRINNCLTLKFLHSTTGLPSDVTECEAYLNREAENVRSGLTKPWA